jgi:hypothetical protein
MIKTLLLLSIIVLLFANCSENKTTKITTNSEKFILPELPKKIKFAGIEYNISDLDIQEKLDREILTNVYYQSATSQIIKRANRFFPSIEKILTQENIPSDFKYLACIESALIAQAESPVGAKGFWQFMPETASEYELQINEEVDERLDITKSTKAACSYLHKAKDTLKDWLLAAASYNRGLGGVKRDMKWQKSTNYFDTEMNIETGRYVYRMLAMKLILEAPEKYGYNIPENQKYTPIKTKSIKVSKSIENIADWSIKKGANYKIVKKLNPWLLKNSLHIKKHNYQILFPTEDENLRPYSSHL